MTLNVRKVDRRRRARIGTFLYEEVAPLSGVGAVAGILVAIIGVIGVIGSPNRVWFGVAGVAGLVVAAFLCRAVIVWETWDQVVAADQFTKNSLVRARTAWLSLPADLRDRARPVLDAAYVAATLPGKAQEETQRREKMIKEFAVEADAQRKARMLQALGEDDLTAARDYLAGLRKTREIAEDALAGGS